MRSAPVAALAPLALVVLALPGSLAALPPAQPAPSAVAPQSPPSHERADLVVAQDGSTPFRTIQAALDTIPRDNTRLRTVLVKNGTYADKVFIRSSHVAIVGEDRDQTRIVFAELRKNWRASHPDDWGAAVVNIADDVTDVFIGNLTIHNNYGSLYGDHDHQFAIRSGGIATRITLVHARVVADGGDTLSLWNTGNGMYYHADCDFEGWVDFVCPRGWCYITNSRFFSHSLTAGIWHDGSRDKDQRFVIRRSSFDGVPGFPLGRNNRDGQFFLLDNRFSATMADRPIYRPSAESAYQWPPRYFYANNRRNGGPFAWFAENLREAEGAPRARDITPAWTFGQAWDPEGTMPAVLPFASTPRPEHGDLEVSAQGTILRWAGARNATAYRVSFGATNPPQFRAEMKTSSVDPGPLAVGTTYYWRVDAVTPTGTIRGPVWSFHTVAPWTTAQAPSPGGGSEPRVAAGAPAATDPTKAPTWRVRIVLVGDSTVTDEVGWGLGFKDRLKDRADCINLARNGRSSKSYLDEGLWKAALTSRADYLLIQFGHNDMTGKGTDRETDPGTTYRANLRRYVDEARAAGSQPVIVTSITRRLFGEDGRIQSDLGPYVEAARAVAAEEHVPLVDLHARSIELLDDLGPARAAEFNIPKADGTPDTTHLSRKASEAFGSIVADELLAAVPALAPYLK